MPDRVRGMVLAAGHGTRLWPLTHHLPKPLLPLLGETLLDRAAAALDRAGCARIAVNTHHLADQIAAHLTARPDRDRFHLSHEPRILGTGGALAGARGFLAGAESILLHNGDVVSDADLAAVLAAHVESGALATLVVADCPQINTVLVAADGVVRDVAGRLALPAAAGDQHLTYTGLAAFSRALLDLVPDGPSDLVTALLAALRLDPRGVRALAPGGLWVDLGTVTRYLDAHAEVLGTDFVSAGEGAVVAPGARLRACVVLPGGVVEADSVLDRAVVGPGWVVTEAQNVALSPAVVRELGFAAATTVVPITGHGSLRRFWRLTDGERRAVVMRDEPGGDDLRRSVAISRFLAAEDLGAAAVLGADVAAGVMVSEDLGEETLHSLAVQRPETMAATYAAAVELLAQLQIVGTARREQCPEACDRAFDRAHLRWETDYFRERFLAGHCGLDSAALADLTPEFEALASAALAQPRVLVHRDFQSQNILLTGGRIRLVDVQGMRLGPVAYDLMALLRDSYVDVPADLRDRLRDAHRERLDALGFAAPDPATWRAWCVTCGLQRVMQALGAFGFLGHVRGKRWYLESIPLGVRHLRELIAEAGDHAGRCAGAPPPLPRLTAVVARIAAAGS